MNNVDSKVIIITGASSGIGAATAQRLARDGMRLTLAARRVDRLEKVATEVESLGGQVLVVPTDVRRYDDIQCMVDKTLYRWGRIDVLFNNAGLGHDDQLIRVEHEDICDEMQVNLIGVILCAKAVLPAMISQRSGHIINVASLAGLVAIPGSSVYSASKFGVIGFSDALRRELCDSGVKVSVFCPSNTPSGISPQLKAIAEGRADAPQITGLLPISYVADQAVRLIYRPRRRVIVPHTWELLIVAAFLFPGLADRLVSSFLPKEIDKQKG
jgi:short-subunit dehydrogenase